MMGVCVNCDELVPVLDLTSGAHDAECRSGTKNILRDADDLTSRDRNQAYGHPFHDYTCTAALWNAILRHAGVITPEVGGEISPELACLMMAAVKMSRLANNIEHHDSLVDVAGYVRCIEMIQDFRRARCFLDSREETQNG